MDQPFSHNANQQNLSLDPPLPGEHVFPEFPNSKLVYFKRYLLSFLGTTALNEAEAERGRMTGMRHADDDRVNGE